MRTFAPTFRRCVPQSASTRSSVRAPHSKAAPGALCHTQAAHTAPLWAVIASKGFWAQIMGVGDFYYELGIQVVESCLLLQDQTGGLADVSLVKRQIERMRGSNAVEITEYACAALARPPALGSASA